jgi:hypothetical protein
MELVKYHGKGGGEFYTSVLVHFMYNKFSMVREGFEKDGL